LAERWAAAWNSGDVDQIVALFTEDAVYEDVPFGMVITGHAELRKLFESNFTTFGDFSVSDVTAFHTDTQGVVRWTMGGKQIGELPGGLAPKGKTFSSRGVSVIELRDGRIARNSDYWDTLSLLKQLGHLPG
jgi:steroid delta-isomerase-like uncharacterized protein